MTNVIVNAIDVLGHEIDEGVVKISAADIQYTGGSLMLPEYHEQELVAGSTTIVGVTPGKMIISIHWGINRTATFRVHIPDTDEITLAELSLQKYDADPAVVAAVTDAARRAEDARDTAVEAAGEAEGIATNLPTTIPPLVSDAVLGLDLMEGARDEAVQAVEGEFDDAMHRWFPVETAREGMGLLWDGDGFRWSWLDQFKDTFVDDH